MNSARHQEKHREPWAWLFRKHETIREQIGTSGADHLESEDTLEIICPRFQIAGSPAKRFLSHRRLESKTSMDRELVSIPQPLLRKVLYMEAKYASPDLNKWDHFLSSEQYNPCSMQQFTYLQPLHFFFPLGLEHIQCRLFQNG